MMKLKKIITEGNKDKTAVFLALSQVFLTSTWDKKEVLKKKQNSLKEIEIYQLL